MANEKLKTRVICELMCCQGNGIVYLLQHILTSGFRILETDSLSMDRSPYLLGACMQL